MGRQTPREARLLSGYLLDTHAALWWWTGLRPLGEAGRAAVESEAPIWVSAVTAYEIALKWRLGKMPALGDPRLSYERLMARNGFSELRVSNAHSLIAGTLEGTHRDPFDRLIAAQALADDLTVITRDREIASVGCKVLW